MDIVERLARLRKRFGITPDKHDAPKDVAVQICANAMDIVKTGEATGYPAAIPLAYGRLDHVLRHQLRVDAHLNIVTGAVVSGMLDCLTTEWHS
jgi:hypothetical protein